MDLAAILEMLKGGMAGVSTQGLVGDKAGLPPAPPSTSGAMPVNEMVRALGGSPPLDPMHAGGGGHALGSAMAAPAPAGGIGIGGPPPAAAAPKPPMPVAPGAPAGDPLAGVPGVSPVPRAAVPAAPPPGQTPLNNISMGHPLGQAGPTYRNPLSGAPAAGPTTGGMTNIPGGPPPNNGPLGQFLQNARGVLTGGATPAKGAAPGLANFLTDAIGGMKGASGPVGQFAGGFSTAAEAGKARATAAKESAREDEKFAMEKGEYARKGVSAADAHSKAVAELANITDPSKAPEMRLKLEGMANDFRKAVTSNDPTLVGPALEQTVKDYMDRLQQSVLGYRQQNNIPTPPPMPQAPAAPGAAPAGAAPALPPPAQVPNLAPGKGVKTPDGKLWQPQGDSWVEVPTS
jgi:hypothetical protein